MRTTTNVLYVQKPDADPNLQALDIYSPDEVKEPHPVVLWVHGGGWMASDKQKEVADKASFFTELGYVFVSVNYRLSPDVQHPAHTQDVAQSIAWVHQNIASYSGNPEQIMLMGHSAGGHIVALLGTNARFLLELGLNPEIIRGVLVVDGVGFDVESRMRRQQKSFSRMYTQAFGSHEEDWADASPVLHVGMHSYSPRFLMLCADHSNQAPVAAHIFCEALDAAKIPAQVTIISNKDHGTINSDIGKYKEVINMVIEDFMKECF